LPGAATLFNDGAIDGTDVLGTDAGDNGSLACRIVDGDPELGFPLRDRKRVPEPPADESDELEIDIVDRFALFFDLRISIQN
jgi:hypothetical protein